MPENSLNITQTQRQEQQLSARQMQSLELLQKPLPALLEELRAMLTGIELGKPETCGDKLKPILSNPMIFGSDLTRCALGERITGYFLEEIQGPGAVRSTLKKYLND